MGNKPRKDEKNKFSIGKICLISAIGTVLFFLLLALFSFFVLKNGITNSVYLPAGLSIGAISAFMAGFAAVRPIKEKGVMYGALTGFIQSMICSVILFVVNGGSAGTGIFILSGLIILLSSVGGITAVNMKIKKKY